MLMPDLRYLKCETPQSSNCSEALAIISPSEGEVWKPNPLANINPNKRTLADDKGGTKEVTMCQPILITN
jgi:hypothetical protein